MPRDRLVVCSSCIYRDSAHVTVRVKYSLNLLVIITKLHTHRVNPKSVLSAVPCFASIAAPKVARGPWRFLVSVFVPVEATL